MIDWTLGLALLPVGREIEQGCSRWLRYSSIVGNATPMLLLSAGDGFGSESRRPAISASLLG